MVQNISKPFTFASNTYAKANEVNADFDSLYTGTNACINQVNKNITDIQNLDDTKADINGNASEVFNVANAESGTHAINKNTMLKYTGNTLDIISGFKITKVDSNTILVSAGSCYDSGRTVVLKTTDSISKQNASQVGSATYYVYIISNNADGSNPDVLISTESVTPSPAPTKYRRIGKYTTNSSNEIEYIYNNDSEMPDTEATISKVYSSGYSWYRVYSDGWCEQGGRVSQSSDNVTVSLLLSYRDKYYNIKLTPVYYSTPSQGVYASAVYNPTSNIQQSYFRVNFGNGSSGSYTYWCTAGYIS